MRILFQDNGSFHSFIWILNAPKIHKKAVYIEFIKKRINAQIPDHFNNPEILLLLLFNCASPVVNILLRRQLLQNYLTLNLAKLKAIGFNIGKFITKVSQKLY